VQKEIPAQDDPFHINHEARVPASEEERASEGAVLAGDCSTRSPGLLVSANDTFSHTSVQKTVESVTFEPRKIPPVNPGPGARKADLLEYIKQQLDCYGKEPLLINRYQLLGPDYRKSGGMSPLGLASMRVLLFH
jgi:hypothetical protein